MNPKNYKFQPNYSLLNQFVGRRSELGRFGQSLISQNVICVTGLLGVGKSSLVLRSLSDSKSVWLEYTSKTNEQDFVSSILIYITDVLKKSTVANDLRSVVEFLEELKLIIVLDNFDYLNSTLQSKCLALFQSIFFRSTLVFCNRKAPKIECYQGYIFKLNTLSERDSFRLIKLGTSLYSSEKVNEREVHRLNSELHGHPQLISQTLKARSINHFSQNNAYLKEVQLQFINNLVAPLSIQQIYILKLFSILDIDIQTNELEDLSLQLLDIEFLLDLHILEYNNKEKSFSVIRTVSNACFSALESQERKALYRDAFNSSTKLKNSQYSKIFTLAKMSESWQNLIDYSLELIVSKATIGEDYFVVDEGYIDELLALNLSYKRDQLLFYKCEFNITAVNLDIVKETISKIKDDLIKEICKARLLSSQGQKSLAKIKFSNCLNSQISLEYKVILYFELCYILIHLKEFDSSELRLKELQYLLDGESQEAQNHCLTILATIQYNQHKFSEALLHCFQIAEYHQAHQNYYALGEAQFYIICNYIGLEDYNRAFEYCERQKLILRT